MKSVRFEHNRLFYINYSMPDRIYPSRISLTDVCQKTHTRLARTKMQMRELNYVKSVGPKTIDVASIIFYVWLTSLLLL